MLVSGVRKKHMSSGRRTKYNNVKIAFFLVKCLIFFVIKSIFLIAETSSIEQVPAQKSILHSRLCHKKSCFYQFTLVVASYVYFSFQKKCRSQGKPKKLKQSLKLVAFLTNKCFVFSWWSNYCWRWNCTQRFQMCDCRRR